MGSVKVDLQTLRHSFLYKTFLLEYESVTVTPASIFLAYSPESMALGAHRTWLWAPDCFSCWLLRAYLSINMVLTCLEYSSSRATMMFFFFGYIMNLESSIYVCVQNYIMCTLFCQVSSASSFESYLPCRPELPLKIHNDKPCIWRFPYTGGKE